MAAVASEEIAARHDPDAAIRQLLGGEVIGAAGHRGPASLAGLEQEYGVWRAGRQLDFGRYIERVVPAGSRRSFAFDANARIVRSGAVWTVDAPHAEIATPPRRLVFGVCGQMADDALTEREALRRRVRGAFPHSVYGVPMELRGYSTHLNAYAAGVDGWALAHRFAVTYGPAVMLLAERPGSPGLLVRPRPKRLEIGTEFLERRDDLVAVSVVVLAAVIAAWQACAADGDSTASRPNSPFDAPGPAPLRGDRLEPTWQRPGYFVGPRAFGDNLYELGRAARLERADGGSELAADRLLDTWAALRPIAATFALVRELEVVDALVAGRAPLPLERGEPLDPLVVRRWHGPRAVKSEQAAVLRTFRRGRLRLSPALATWDLTVLQVEHPDRTFYLRLPRAQSQPFVALLSAGRFDAELEAYGSAAPSGRTALLDEPAAGLFDRVEAPTATIARQDTGKSAWPGPGKARKATPALPPPPLPPVTARPSGGVRQPWPAWLIPLIAILLLTAVTILVFVRLPRESRSTPSPTAACAPSQALVANNCGSATPGQPSTTPSGCAVGAACGSAVPTGAPPSATPCPAALACGTPAPSPRPTPRPTPSPTLRPTPRPDRTGPTITRLAWTPTTIGVPPVGAPACGPASGLGQVVTVTVRVTDPSGVANVQLRYRRSGDAAPITVAMTLQAGLYRVTLSTAADPAGWMQAPGPPYLVALSVRAVDGRGNVRTSPTAPGFTVAYC
jgi:hypothetical protein